ncbi:MAG: hypothetical protein LBT04_09965 [Prevotellaceae bacterium]|jgi:hypothetical protein|nr:hypothetical protein [Prevotellaceae bacterium]
MADKWKPYTISRNKGKFYVYENFDRSSNFARAVEHFAFYEDAKECASQRNSDYFRKISLKN